MPFTYTVRPGDTLYSIARLYGTTVRAIAEANDIVNPSRIQVGRRLVIPVREVLYTIRPGDTLAGIARRFGVDVDRIIQANNIQNPSLIFAGQVLVIPGEPTDEFITYTVKPGDTLWSIARRFGRTVEELVEVNNLPDPELIYVGQELLIPRVVPAPQAIYRGDSGKPLIAFTFDATYGDNQTEQLLQIMDRYNFRSTFFLSGIWVERYPELARAIRQAGHEIGNHSYNHPEMAQLSEPEIRSQLNRAENIIRQVIGVRPVYFRPPFGEFTDRILEIASEEGYQTIMWTVDSLDWQTPGVEVIVSRVVEGAKNGAIILMHQAGRQTPEALERIVQQLQTQFRFGTVTDVLDP